MTMGCTETLGTPWPSFYLPLGLRSPVYITTAYLGDGMTSDYIAHTIEQLDTTRVQYILLWSPRLDTTKFNEPQATLLRDYLHRNYTPVQTFSDGETIWERDAASGRN